MRRPFLLTLAATLFLGHGGCNRPEKAVPKPAEKIAVPPTVAIAPPTDETLGAFAAVLDKALTAYNAGDQKALFADFAKTATPPADDRIFTELYEGYYKTDFGRIVALRLYELETVSDPEFGMLVYLAQCERVKLARVSANFVRENGAPKIVQLRFERVDTTAK